MNKLLGPYAPIAYLVAILAVVGGILLYGKTQYDKGYSVAKAEAVLQVAKERAAEFTRQTAANVAAQTQALDDIARLSLNNAGLQQLLKDNQHAAASSPTASRECLDASSVRRLNAIR